MKNVYRLLFLLGLSTILFFINNACSSGGGGSSTPAAPASSLSGSAVAGAPIIGNVTIKDSSSPPNTKLVKIEADGKYTIDVTGLTAPFMLRADGTVGGRSYSIYSAATQADVNGNINVTPLTDLIVANIAGQIAGNFFTAGNFASLTASDLTAAATALQARLQPILTAVGVSGSIDLLRASFAADHTGLDAALDVLRVDVNSGTGIATITSILNSQTITNDPATHSDTTPIDATGVSASLTDLQAIIQVFNSFGTFFATSLPLPSNTSLLALFDGAFLHDGQNSADFLSNLTSDPNMIGIKFGNVSLVPGSLTANAATVKFVPIQGGVPGDLITFNMVKPATAWLIKGNERQAQVRMSAFSRMQDVYISSVLHTNYIDTGLKFDIKDSGGMGFDYAIIKGSGLPVGGALYFDEGTGNSLTAALLGAAYTGSGTTRVNDFGHEQLPLDDTAIGNVIDNSDYSIELWEDNGTPSNLTDDTKLVTYTETLGKHPYLSTELAVASFAGFTSPSKSTLLSFAAAGGTQQVTWTLPSGLSASELSFYRHGDGSGSSSTDVQNSVAATATSGSITTTAIDTSAGAFGNLQGADLNVFTKDSFGRELVSIFTAP